MNREIVEKEILSLQNKTIVAELPTSFGKTKIALSIMKSRVANLLGEDVLDSFQKFTNDGVKEKFNQYIYYFIRKT